MGWRNREKRRRREGRGKSLEENFLLEEMDSRKRRRRAIARGHWNCSRGTLMSEFLNWFCGEDLMTSLKTRFRPWLVGPSGE